MTMRGQKTIVRHLRAITRCSRTLSSVPYRYLTGTGPFESPKLCHMRADIRTHVTSLQ